MKIAKLARIVVMGCCLMACGGSGDDSTEGGGNALSADQQPPPPPIGNPIPPGDPTDPFATLTNEEFNSLRDRLGLAPTEATSTNSPLFEDKVKLFQQWLGKNQTGLLTQTQLTIALQWDSVACVSTEDDAGAADQQTGFGDTLPPLPPPPVIDTGHPAPPEDPTDPFATLTNEEFKSLRDRLGLTPTNATLPNSPLFKDKVKLFQQWVGKNQTGILTQKQLIVALQFDSKCTAKRT